MVQKNNTKQHPKEIYQSDNGCECVSVKTMGNTYVNISVSKYFSFLDIVYFLSLLISNYFLCINSLHVVFSYHFYTVFLYLVTLLFCLYKNYTILFSPRKESVILLDNIGLQITTQNFLCRESSEYLSYCDIEDFVIVEMFHRQFSVVTYLSCLLTNKQQHKILFGNFNLKLSQLEVMYQSVKHVLRSKHSVNILDS